VKNDSSTFYIINFELLDKKNRVKLFSKTNIKMIPNMIQNIGK